MNTSSRRRWLNAVGVLGTGLALAVTALAEDSVPKSASRDTWPQNWDSPTFGGLQFWTDELVFHEWRIQRHSQTGHCRLLDEKNVRKAWGAFEVCKQDLEAIKQAAALPPLKPRVILVLHGLMRTRESMEDLCQHLRKSPEFSVLNVSYASSRRTLADHAAALAKIVDHLEGVSEVNFVGHSLGNLVIRHYLHDRAGAGQALPGPRLGRVVMLAPPNNGAEMARRFQENPLFRAVWGITGNELGAKWSELETQLAVPACEFGILAGGKGDGVGRSPLVAGDDDFIVGVEETRLPGAADFLVLPVLHGSIMSDDKVQACTLQFLRSGFFLTHEARQPIPRQPHE
jgi:pimeloyl-ACP methyl ester carboxylesterase